MIQLNLLPDVKMSYIKAERLKRLIISVSILVSAVSLGILILLVIVNLAFHKHINDMSNTISTDTQTLKSEPDITQLLTVQNQLKTLTTLYNGEPDASRLFDSYFDQTTPNSVSISNFSIDFTKDTVDITGNADSLVTINQYVDTLKFTTYTYNNSKPKNAFDNVVLTNFGINTQAQNAAQQASFSVTFTFDPIIFNISDNVVLSVPNVITTRSELAQPNDLFKTVPSTNNSGGSN